MSRTTLCCLLCLVCPAALQPVQAAAAKDWVPAQTIRCVQTVTGFAVVQAPALASIAAITSGSIAGLTLLPGDRVTRGEAIARLTGPEVKAALVQASAAIVAAQAEKQAAQAILAADRAKLPERLVTRQEMAQAEAKLATASAKIRLAQAEQLRLQQSLSIVAPISGTVPAVTAGNGSHVAAGESILTIQPDTGAFLRATLYGRAAFAIGAGAAGRFTPASGDSPGAVRVQGVRSATLPDGGEVLTLSFAGSASPPGTFGRVDFSLPPRRLPAVPNRALILDRGKWWVMVHHTDGVQPVQVVPGPQMRGSTCIEHGLAAGDEVVTVNPYLAYNRGIAAQYQPPD